jgi:hypothetical protein
MIIIKLNIFFQVNYLLFFNKTKTFKKRTNLKFRKNVRSETTKKKKKIPNHSNEKKNNNLLK